MAKNGTQKLQDLTISLNPELRAFVEREAEKESRSVAGQIRHFVVEAARRNGTPTLTPWPPPMSLPASLDEARAELAELSAEFAKLKAFQRRGGANGLGLLPHQDERFRYLRDHVTNLQNYVAAHEKMESTA